MAGAIKGLTVEIGGRTDQLRSALRGVTSDATRLQQELRAIDKELKFNPGNAVLVEQKLQALSEKSAVLREKLAVLTAAQKQNYEAWQRYAAVKDELEPLNRQVKETSDRMAVLTKRAKEAEAAFNSGKGTEEAYKKAKKAMEECEDELKRLVARQKELSKDTVSNEQYRELTRTIEQTENQIRDCEVQMVKLGSVTATQMEVAEAKTAEFGARIKQELQAIDDGLRLNPGNVVLVEQKFQALSEKATALRGKLAELTAAQKQNYEAWKKYSAVKDELESLGRQIKETSDRMGVLTKRAEEAEAAFRSGDGTLEEYKKAAKAVEECDAELKQLIAHQQELSKGTLPDEQYREFERTIEKAKSQLKDCEAQMIEFGSVAAVQLEAAGAKATEFGTKLQSASGATSGLSMASAMVGAGIIGMSVDFEKSMSKVRALSGATGTELDELSDKARDMGATTVYTAGEAAEAMSYMALAGWKTDEMLEGIEPILNLATAGNMDLAEASDIVTDYLTAFGLSAKDSATFVDQLAYAQANSNTTVEQLGEAFKNCAAAAGSVGYSTADVTSALMVMANAGVKGSDAGTALKSIMVRLASDTSGCAAALHEYGVEIYDSDGNMRSLHDILTETSQVMQGLTDEEQANLSKVIAGTYQYSRFQTIMAGFGQNVRDVGKDYETYNQALQECGGSAKEMADIMQDNLWGALKHLQSVLSESALQIGEQMTPAIEEACDVITRVADEFNSLSPSVKRAAGEALALGAALSPALAAMAVLTKGVGGLMTATGKATSTVKGALGLVEGVPGLFQRLTGAIEKVVPASTKAAASAKHAATQTQSIGAAATKASAATSLLANVGLMAVVAAIGLLVAKYAEYRAHVKLVEDATEGLDEATKGLSGALGNTSDDARDGATGVDKYRRALDEAKTSSDDALKANRNYAQSMRDLTKDYQASNTLVGDYRDTIVDVCRKYKDLADGEELAANDKARLDAAVEGLNGKLGTEYESQKLLEGAYGESGDALGGLIGELDKYVQMAMFKAKLDAESTLLEEGIRTQIEDQNALNDAKEAEAAAQERLVEAQKAYNDALMAGGSPEYLEAYALQVSDAEAKVKSASDAVDVARGVLDATNDSIRDIKDDVDQTTQAMNGTLGGMDMLNQLMSVSGRTMDQLGIACDEAGVHVESLAGLSSSQLTSVAQDFDGTGASITSSLQQLGIDIDQHSGEALDAYLANLESGKLTTESSAEEVRFAIAGSMGSIRAACGEAGIGFDSLAQLGDEKLQTLMASCDGHKESLCAALDQMGIDISYKASETMDAYAAAVADGAIRADSSAEQVRAAIQAKLDEAAQQAPAEGDATADGYNESVAAGAPGTEQAAQQVASKLSVLDAAKSAYDWGSHLVQNFAQGIVDGASWIADSVSNVLAPIWEQMGHSIAKKGPLHVGGKGEAEWGRHLVQNFAQGMNESTHLITEAADRLAVEATAGLSDLGGGLLDAGAASATVRRAYEVQMRADDRLAQSRAYDGANVVRAVQELSDKVDGVQVVLDTGAVAGAVTDKVDRNLGKTRRKAVSHA